MKVQRGCGPLRPRSRQTPPHPQLGLLRRPSSRLRHCREHHSKYRRPPPHQAAVDKPCEVGPLYRPLSRHYEPASTILSAGHDTTQAVDSPHYSTRLRPLHDRRPPWGTRRAMTYASHAAAGDASGVLVTVGATGRVEAAAVIETSSAANAATTARKGRRTILAGEGTPTLLVRTRARVSSQIRQRVHDITRMNWLGTRSASHTLSFPS